MRRCRIMMAVAGAAAVWCTPPLAGCPTPSPVRQAAEAGAARAGSWGPATGVPGLRALNAGGSAQVSSVSCISAGKCLIGGYYADRSKHSQAFVADQRNGRWASATEVPGSGALNADGYAQVASVSCASTGNCVIGGFYADRSKHFQAFVASGRNGTWGSATEVPGAGTLSAGGAVVNSVSCASTGNCAIGGYYADRSKHFQAFVASGRNGTWGSAIEVPGTATVNAGGNAEVASVSCTSAGNCAAGGFYTDGSRREQAFVASGRDGRWGSAIEVPGTATVNAGGGAAVTSLSCASVGTCTAGGFYTDGSGHRQAFVASERNGTWGSAIEVPGTAALNAGGYDRVLSVSCVSAGNCAVGGYYWDSSDNRQAFVVSERNGTWGSAIEVPGTAALNAGGHAQIVSVSCASAGNCVAAGLYTDSSGASQGFVASQS